MKIIDRTEPLYEKGVLDFIEFAFNGFGEEKLLRCPCKKCYNIIFQSKRIIYEHLIIIGIRRDYIIWDLHGEVTKKYRAKDNKLTSNNEIHNRLCNIRSDENKKITYITNLENKNE